MTYMFDIWRLLFSSPGIVIWSRSGLDNINEQQCLAQLGSVSVENPNYIK